MGEDSAAAAVDEPSRPGDAARELAYAATSPLVANPPPVARRSHVVLIILGLFAVALVSRRGAHALPELAILIAVVVVHELGHALAMRLAGYSDGRIFVLPIFGAATAGANRDVAPWKEGAVLLAGPLPGIAAGVVLLATGAEDTARTAAILLLGVNALNLLPVAPLDGGQLFQLAVFSRHRALEVAFLYLVGAGLIVGYLVTENMAMIFIGVFVVVAAGRRGRVLDAGDELRELALPADPRTLDDDQRRQVFEAAWRITHPRARNPRLLAGTVEGLVEIASRRPLSRRATGALLAVWLAGVGAAAFGAQLALDPPEVRWGTYHGDGGRFAIELPSPVFEEAHDTFTMLVARNGPLREYTVGWTTVPSEHLDDWIPTLRARMLGDAEPERDIAPGEVVFPRNGRVVHLRLVRRGPRGYMVIAIAPSDDAESERVIRSLRLD